MTGHKINWDTYRGRLFVNYIQPYFKDVSKIKALDVGCRYGAFTFEMAKAFNFVVGIDIDTGAINKIKDKAHNYNNLEITEGNILKTEFKDESFDLVVLEGVLEWVGLSNPKISPTECQLQTLRECRRILKDKGMLFCGIENKLFPLYWLRDPHSHLPLTAILPRFLSKKLYALLRNRKYYGQQILSYWGYSKMFHKVYGNCSIMIPVPIYKYLYDISSFRAKELREKSKKVLRIKLPRKTYIIFALSLRVLSLLHLTKLACNFIIISKRK